MPLPTLADLTGNQPPSYSSTVDLPPSAQLSSVPQGPPSQTISDWILAALRYGSQALFGTTQAQDAARQAQAQAQLAQQKAAASQNTLIGVGVAALLIIGLLIVFGGKGRGPSLGEFVGRSKRLQVSR